MSRSALLLAALLSAGAWAGEQATAPAPQFSFSTTGGGWSFSPDRPSELLGVRIRYEAVVIDAGRLTYRMAAFPGASRPVLGQARLESTAELPLLFDTSASTLPTIAFRGVLRPKDITVQRREADPAAPGIVRFRCELSGVGDLHGMLSTTLGLRQLVAWADHIVLDLQAPVDAASTTGMGVPRLVTMTLYGSQKTTEAPANLVRIVTLREPVGPDEATVARQWDGPGWGIRKSNDLLSLQFADDGTLLGAQEGEVGTYEERNGEGLVLRKQSTSAPSLKP